LGQFFIVLVLMPWRQFLIGAIVVLVATFLYGNQLSNPILGKVRPPPIRIEAYEKRDGEGEANTLSPPNDFSIKLPTTPLLSTTTAGLSTSRPTSPIHTSRVGSTQNAANVYFLKTSEE
jgi:UDP-sugar transporter A1/2/3